jgi:hypothetical protein
MDWGPLKYSCEIIVARPIEDFKTGKRFGDAAKNRDKKGTENCRGAAEGRNG